MPRLQKLVSILVGIIYICKWGGGSLCLQVSLMEKQLQKLCQGGFEEFRSIDDSTLLGTYASNYASHVKSFAFIIVLISNVNE